MKITYLGQAGLMIESNSKILLIDPYLSDSVEKVNPLNYRRQPIDERFLAVRPDVVVCTHDHLDHYDEETLVHYLGQKEHPVLFLAPYSAWQKARGFGNGHNYVMFNRGTKWTFGDITLRAVKAEHSDLFAIGLVLEIEGKRLYITGDTLYNEEIFKDLQGEFDAIFLPVNGLGNNMNKADAAEFVKRAGGRKAVPMHVGLFDEMTAEDFAFEPKILPRIYEEIVL